jgi:hypothetical protein
MMKNIFLLLLFIVVTIASCKKDNYDPGTTKSPNASNGWWVTYSIDGTPIYGPVFFSTYNTAADKADSMWIDDLENFWQFRGKVALNYSALTFSSDLSENDYYSSEAKIANGKILPKGGHSKSGVATDSIYMEIQFSDDSPAYGTTYQISGTARTGFIEDDY